MYFHLQGGYFINYSLLYYYVISLGYAYRTYIELLTYILRIPTPHIML